MNEMICAECGGAMEEGFIRDLGHMNADNTSAWVGGAPERSIWTGVQVTGKPQFEVAAYRCAGCGLLRSYARKIEKS